MPTPLHSRLHSLRGRVRRLLALHGLSLIVAAVAVFTLLACLADWAIQLASEVRVGLLAAMAGATLFLFARHVVAPLVVRFRDLDIAMKIERRWPGLEDRLASTVQFLDLERAGVGDREDVLGSRALRDATVKQTLAETDAIDFRQVVDPKPARRAMLIGLAAVGLGLAVYSLDPRLGGIAVKRLFLPFASNPWPQMTHLAILKAPTKMARGETFVLEVGVGADERAPGSAKITYTYDDGEKVTESLRPDDRNKFHGRKEAVEKSFTFTVAAGDDATAKRKGPGRPPAGRDRLEREAHLPGLHGHAPADARRRRDEHLRRARHGRRAFGLGQQALGHRLDGARRGAAADHVHDRPGEPGVADQPVHARRVRPAHDRA